MDYSPNIKYLINECSHGVGGYIHIVQDYLSNILIRLNIKNFTAQKISWSSPQAEGLSNSDFDDRFAQYDRFFFFR